MKRSFYQIQCFQIWQGNCEMNNQSLTIWFSFLVVIQLFEIRQLKFFQNLSPKGFKELNDSIVGIAIFSYWVTKMQCLDKKCLILLTKACSNQIAVKSACKKKSDRYWAMQWPIVNVNYYLSFLWETLSKTSSKCQISFTPNWISWDKIFQFSPSIF